MKTLLGKKIGMTQIFTEDGQVVPVTVVEAGPEVVTLLRLTDTMRYRLVTKTRKLTE